MKTSNKAASKTASPQAKAAQPKKTAASVKAAPASGKAAAKTTKAAPASPVVTQAAPAKKTAKAVAETKAKTQAAKPTATKASAAVSQPSSAAPSKAASAASVKKSAPVSQAKSMTVKKAEPVKAPVDQAPVSVVVPSGPDQLVRATRPSARLAQITVPSLPPAVASTAAKASFLPSAPAPTVMSFVPVKKDLKLANNWKTKSLQELTDAEILAMPDSEYMNDVQMAFFKRKLVKLKQDILNSAGETTEHLREDTVVVPDPADRATIEEEHALELRTRDRERKLLKKIEQSIMLIDAGDYGYCDETGEPIGVGRLLARPTATLSLEAQQRRELKQKMFGD